MSPLTFKCLIFYVQAWWRGNKQRQAYQDRRKYLRNNIGAVLKVQCLKKFLCVFHVLLAFYYVEYISYAWMSILYEYAFCMYQCLYTDTYIAVLQGMLSNRLLPASQQNLRVDIEVKNSNEQFSLLPHSYLFTISPQAHL